MDLFNSTNSYLLKIDKNVYKSIEDGSKTIEYRKLNKDYIQKGSLIYFVDKDNFDELGKALVLVKSYAMKDVVVETEEHILTREFIKTNYNDEKVLIAFGLLKWRDS